MGGMYSRLLHLQKSRYILMATELLHFDTTTVDA